MTTPGEDYLNGAKRFLETGLFSDLTIRSQDEKGFKVHKVILCSQSKYFRKLLDGGFKEQATSEVTLPEDYLTLQPMIHFLYNFQLDDKFCPPGVSKPVYYVHVYQIADKYDIPCLATIAATRLKATCQKYCNYAKLARQQPDNGTITALQVNEHRQAVVDAIDAINDCTNPNDRTLWDGVVGAVWEDLAELLGDETFEKIVMQNGRFAVSLLKGGFKLLEEAKAAAANARQELNSLPMGTWGIGAGGFSVLGADHLQPF